jgi:5'-3' exonuclease
MGVKKLYAWVKRAYPFVILRRLKRTLRVRAPQRPAGAAAAEREREREQPQTKDVPLRFGGLSIDGNALLHEAAQWVYGYGRYEDERQGIPNKLADGTPNPDVEKRLEPSAELVGDRFVWLIEEALALLRPSTRLYIAIDGVAPLAKAQQQRTRRFLAAARTASQAEDAQDAAAEIDEGEVPAGREGAFDSSFISPGTPFMDRIDERIRAWLRANQSRLPRDTIYWSHRVPGEGEHKLVEALSTKGKVGARMRSKSGKVVAKGRDEVDAIYGNDNDLIILAMVRTRRTVILRDAMDRRGDPELLRNPSEIGRFAIVDVDSLREALRRRYDVTPADFSVLMLLLGNDFVPTTPAGFDVYGMIDTALELYAQLKSAKPGSREAKQQGETRYALFDSRVRWSDLYYLVAALVRVPEGERATREQQLLAKRYEQEEYSNSERNRGYDGKPPKRIERTAALQNAASIDRGRVLIDIDAFRDAHWRKAFPGLSGSPYEGEVVLDVVDAYLEAFVWSTTYYVLGVSHVNVEWFFRYYYAPTLVEVRDTLRALKDDDPTRWERLPLDRSGRFLNPLELEVAILPLPVLNQVLYASEEISDELNEKVFTPLRDLYPEQVDVDGEGQDIADKAVVRLPFVDAKRVRDVARSLRRPDVAAIERRALERPFEQLQSGRTKTGRVVRQPAES